MPTSSPLAHAAHQKKQPLILSGHAHDVHAAAVCWALRQSGYRPTWAQTLADATMAPVSLHADDRAGLRFAGGIDPAQTSSVWFRRPRLPETFDNVSPADLAFVRDEWKRHVGNVHAVAGAAGDVFWVNRPDRALATENKYLQLQAAHRCGLRFPATLISSDPEEIRRFFATHERIVYKPFATHSWRDGDGRIYSTYVRTLDADALQDDAALRLCPGIYQACVRKRYDLRVTVIGRRMFAVRVDAPEADDGVVDWRAASIGDHATSRPYALTHAWETALRRLMDALGLVFGCIDLVADDHDELHFLEINQSGQFLFVEHDAPDVPLLRAMAAMLAEGRSDYALDTIAELSYADFLADPEQKAWWESVAPGIRGENGEIAGLSEE
jgi:glutathione synthase/RimK-type ligase-like ATP-grasp enzyme